MTSVDRRAGPIGFVPARGEISRWSLRPRICSAGCAVLPFGRYTARSRPPRGVLVLVRRERRVNIGADGRI